MWVKTRVKPWEPGTGKIPALKGRHKSIQDISFSVCNVMSLQERSEFLFERHLALVVFLSGYVCTGLAYSRFAHRERAVSVLPMEIVKGFALRLYPRRRTRLDLLNHLGQGAALGQTEQDMRVIGDAGHGNGRTIKLPKGPRKISAQLFSQVHRNQLPSVLRAEDDVRNDLCQRLGHGRIHTCSRAYHALSGPLHYTRSEQPGLDPGLTNRCPAGRCRFRQRPWDGEAFRRRPAETPWRWRARRT